MRAAWSRREFGKALAAGVPLVSVLTAARVAARGQVTFGVTTTSFRELPRVPGQDNVDAIVQALKSVGVTKIDLAMANVEPAPPNMAPFMGGSAAYPVRVTPTPEQVAASNAGYRAALREWRAAGNLAHFEQAGATFAAAGLGVHACTLAYDDSFTDDEIDVTMKQATALGATTIASPVTLATAARLVPFAERHRLSIAIHNQADGNAAGQIATGQLTEALALSPRYTLKLDIGNLAASNADAVTVLRTHLARVSHVVVRDRLRNGGASQHFGEGDTPIGPVLKLLADAPAPVPAMVEYDYTGLHPAAEEVATSLAYLKRAIQ